MKGGLSQVPFRNETADYDRNDDRKGVVYRSLEHCAFVDFEQRTADTFCNLSCVVYCLSHKPV